VLVSVATKRNWERLGVVDFSERLNKRANKTKSQKQFVPLECLKNTTAFSVEEIIKIVKSELPETAIYSLAHKLVEDIHNQAGKNWFFEEYSRLRLNKQVYAINLPNEQDILGIIYQSLITEGQKNKKGSYFTPLEIASKLVDSFEFTHGQKFLDPACGSGSFLLSLNCGNPTQIFGCDNDPIAVMIARANMLLKYSGVEFIPNIFEADFLANGSLPDFNYIATNPPWGAVNRSGAAHENLFSNELFSCFLHKSLQKLKPGGTLSFLLPQSFLNVKTHTDIRKYVLGNFNVEKIRSFANIFSNVTTEFVELVVKNSPTGLKYTYIDKNNFSHEIQHKNSPNFVFNFTTAKDNEILAKVEKLGKYTLDDSTWGLGIVTGDNKNKLLDSPTEKTEPIYTGKEVAPFALKEPLKFIVYDRANFQQAAPDEIYRADEKLIYKFISNKLVFAYDNKQSLCLNSANILIPKIPGMSMKTVMAFLNSTLFRFVYTKQSGQVKVLRGNLCELLFPALSLQQDEDIAGLSNLNDIDEYLYEFYCISAEQKNHINEVFS
jgi:type I restriction-modification system DNA methylase subunit